MGISAYFGIMRNMRITTKQKQTLKRIAKKFSVNLFILFGSRAKNKQHALSDVDIAFRSKKRLTFDGTLSLGASLDKLFGDSDLIDINRASPLLLAAIVKDGVLFYEEKQGNFAEFKIQAINQYLDYKPWLDKQAKYNRKAIRKL